MMQVRVAAALSRIAAQEEQSFDGWEERINKWDKARREKEKKEEGEIPPIFEIPFVSVRTCDNSYSTVPGIKFTMGA